ncbi:MAG: glycosyltransferase family 39 protein, partial [Planctomycetota bacterium]|nr:glycosyltransferase family 39 protein [Planctomycetota bacterium]
MTSSHLPPIAQDSSVAFLDGRRADVLCFLLLLGSALATNLLHRPLLVDDTTVALEWADSVFGSEAIALSNQTEDTPPFFPFLVYLSTLLCGRTVLALHLFPLLASLFNPILVYVLFRDVFQERSRALGGALLFLLWPSALFYYNQAVAEPITLTLVLGMLLSYRRQWTALTL